MDNVNNVLDRIQGQLIREVDRAYENIMALSETELPWRYAVMDAEWAKIDSCVHWLVNRDRISDFNHRMTPEMIRNAILKGGA